MKIPKLTAIGSGKGGTGKTLVATALAAALAGRGERILLCDADLGLSNTTVHLGLPAGGDLIGLLAGRTALCEAVVRVKNGPQAKDGFDLLSAPSGSGAFANFDESVAARLVSKLRNAENYDRILLDLSAGVDATTMGFAAHADETLLVMTPDPAALTDAYAFVKILLRVGGSRPLAIVNMAESEAEARRTNDALTKTCRAFLKTSPDYLGGIPRDFHAVAAIRQQRALALLFPQAPATQAVEAIARRLCEYGTRRHAPDALQRAR